MHVEHEQITTHMLKKKNTDFHGQHKTCILIQGRPLLPLSKGWAHTDRNTHIFCYNTICHPCTPLLNLIHCLHDNHHPTWFVLISASPISTVGTVEGGFRKMKLTELNEGDESRIPGSRWSMQGSEPTPGLQDWTFDSSGFWAVGTLMSTIWGTPLWRAAKWETLWQLWETSFLHP